MIKAFKQAAGWFLPRSRRRLPGLVFLVWVSSVGAQETVKTNQAGLLIELRQAKVELSAATPDVLRVSVAYDGPPHFIPSTFLADTNAVGSVPWQLVRKHGMVGIRTKAGELFIHPQTGEWTLLNAAGKVLIPRHELGDLNGKTSAETTNVTITLGWNRREPVLVYGCGNGTNTLPQSKATTGVSNGRAVVP